MLTLALWALLAEAPLYTNDDLDRVAPRRDEVGAFTTPPRAEGGRAADRERSPAAAKKGESYWRREAERTRDRVRVLRDRQDALRERITARERVPGVRPVSDPQLQSLGKAVAALETRIREEEARLDDRARREGALPGWLR
jgi:hypothetical protein